MRVALFITRVNDLFFPGTGQAAYPGMVCRDGDPQPVSVVHSGQIAGGVPVALDRVEGVHGPRRLDAILVS